METKSKGVKTLTNLLSKTAGLVFFSFLAISLGVVFGLLFEGWVKDQPGTPVGTDSSNLQTVDLQTSPVTDMKPTAGSTVPGTKPTETASTKPSTGQPTANAVPGTVRYKVRVGPYTDRNAAVNASQQLQEQGYPVYVNNNPPYAVQVGAFGAQANADHLKTELIQKGYKAFIEKN